MKAFSLVLTLLLALAVNCSVTAQEEQSAAKSFEQLQKFNRFYRYLDATYVDQVDMEPLVEDAIRSMLEDLDPQRQVHHRLLKHYMLVKPPPGHTFVHAFFI